MSKKKLQDLTKEEFEQLKAMGFLWELYPEAGESWEEEHPKDKVEAALDVIYQYGGTDGGHHKMWVIDQVVRKLTGDKYEEWVKKAKAGEDGPETYSWDEGVAP